MIPKMIVAGLPMIIVFLFDMVVNNPMGFYYRWWWFDIPMHMLGGFVAAWSVARFFKDYKKLVALKPWAFEVFVLVSGTALIGILWEVYEFFMSLIFNIVMQPSVADTVADLVNDCVGALLFCLFIHFYRRHAVSSR